MLRYRRYGSRGPRISSLGFGVMRLPTRKQGEWGRVNFTRATEVLRAALDAGVNFFDSHHGYHGGHSEVAIGKALKGWKGQRIYIQTKTPWYREEPTEFFEKLLYEALEKLGVDSIDYLLHHSMNMAMWEARGRQFIKFTDWALNRGLIRHRGFSSHDSPEHIQQFVDTGEFSVMLVSYNWMNPQVRDVIAYAADRGMGVTVMNPVGGGMLAESTPQIMRLLPGAKSAPEICLRYVLATPGVTCVLSGMGTLAQVTENVAVASRRSWLTARQLETMQTRMETIERAARACCTACGYCMPCEHGVDIPTNFGLLNRAKLYGQVEGARQQYAGLKTHPEGDRSAAACQRCGECLPKCPNSVPIIDQLDETRSLLGAADG